MGVRPGLVRLVPYRVYVGKEELEYDKQTLGEKLNEETDGEG